MGNIDGGYLHKGTQRVAGALEIKLSPHLNRKYRVSQSHVSSRLSAALLLPPTTANPDMATPVQASGRGATGLSRAHPASAQHPTVFSSVNDAALKARLSRHDDATIAIQRNRLFNALRQHQDVDVAQLILRTLFVKNKSQVPGRQPKKCELYMGFGEVSPEQRPSVAALAKQLRQSAYALWPQLNDMASKNMLDWIAQDWAIYEKLYQAPGTRLAIYRTHPLTATAQASLHNTTASAEAHPVWQRLEDASEVLVRAGLRDDLITALTSGDTGLVDDLLTLVPPGIDQLSKYLPPPLATSDFGSTLRAATWYHKHTNTQLSNSLCAFVSAACARSQGAIGVAETQQEFTEQDLKQLCAPTVRTLCLAFRDLPESDIDINASDLEVLITQALNISSLEVQLGRQPYVNLKVLMLKCTVLAEHLNPNALGTLRRHVQNAHATQLKETRRLQEELLMNPLNESTIAALSPSVYARSVTTVSADFVCAGASWMKMNAMAKSIGQVYTQFQKTPILCKFEMAALTWVRKRIQFTEEQARKG